MNFQFQSSTVFRINWNAQIEIFKYIQLVKRYKEIDLKLPLNALHCEQISIPFLFIYSVFIYYRCDFLLFGYAPYNFKNPPREF